MPVSELEKKAERKMSAARTEKSRPSGASFKSGLNLWILKDAYLEEKPGAGQGLSGLNSAPLQHQFQHQLGAHKPQYQQAEARQGEPHGRDAAPAALVMAPQQYRKQ